MRKLSSTKPHLGNPQGGGSPLRALRTSETSAGRFFVGPFPQVLVYRLRCNPSEIAKVNHLNELLKRYSMVRPSAWLSYMARPRERRVDIRVKSTFSRPITRELPQIYHGKTEELRIFGRNAPRWGTFSLEFRMRRYPEINGGMA